MPHSRPDAAELLEAVSEFLIHLSKSELSGQSAFHARVAANALTIVGREQVEKPRMTEEEALAKDLSTYDLLSVTAPGAPVNADEIETLPDEGDPWIVESIV